MTRALRNLDIRGRTNALDSLALDDNDPAFVRLGGDAIVNTGWFEHIRTGWLFGAGSATRLGRAVCGRSKSYNAKPSTNFGA